jgi:hypothetical protein
LTSWSKRCENASTRPRSPSSGIPGALCSGVLYAACFPEKVAAYVGSGQIGNWSAGEALSDAFALAEAQRLNNRKAMKALRAMGPPPHTASSLWTERTWLQRFDGQLGGRAHKRGRIQDAGRFIRGYIAYDGLVRAPRPTRDGR